MKLCLVSTHHDEIREVAPLGLAYLATYLRDVHGFGSTKIVDVNIESPLERLRQEKPDVVGISSMTLNYNVSVALAEKVKKELDVPVMLGGVHFSTLPTMLNENFDIGVVGEGEKTLAELVDIFERDGEFKAEKLEMVDGLVYRNDGALKQTKKRELIENLDDVPIPDRSFLGKEYFKPRVVFWDEGNIGREVSLLTSRGCPYNCIFCSTTRFWSRTRFNSARRVVDEIKYLNEKFGATHLLLWDDLFAVSVKRLTEIADIMKAEGLTDKVTFWAQLRSNVVTEHLCKDLKRMNVRTIAFGFESGNERMLKYLKGQHMSVQFHRQAVKLCLKYGFRVGGTFILGSPTEQIAEMRDTLDFIHELGVQGCTDLGVYVMTPFPGTEVWRICKERGKVSEDMDWGELQHYGFKRPFALDDDVPPQEFAEIYKEARRQVGLINASKANRWKMLYNRLRYYPVKTLKTAVKRPDRALRFIRRLLLGKYWASAMDDVPESKDKSHLEDIAVQPSRHSEQV